VTEHARLTIVKIDAARNASNKGRFVEGGGNMETQFTRTECAVRAPNRNGHAYVVGQLVEVIGSAPSEVRRAPMVFLTREAEDQLRDGDEAQLGLNWADARTGPRETWRGFLRAHIRRSYGLMVVFDAATLHVE
jgi:hypothetical protein